MKRNRGKADLLLSFGPATWPHMLVRAMLAEQLFRATASLPTTPIIGRDDARCAAPPCSSPLRCCSRRAARRSLPAAETVDAALARARAEAGRRRPQVARLEAGAARAGDEASRLRAEQAAAAAAIEAAEARISASDARAAMARTRVAAGRERLAAPARPVAALLAGLATMGRRPPLLTLADHGRSTKWSGCALCSTRPCR